MKMIKALLAATFLLSGLAFAADEHDQAMVERIKAVGQVCKTGANCAAEAGAPAAKGGAARSGAEIVTKHCVMCHGGMPGAPKTGAEWAARTKAAGGIDALVASAAKGKNAMPPKGMCMDCSTADLKAAIVEMSKSK